MSQKSLIAELADRSAKLSKEADKSVRRALKPRKARKGNKRVKRNERLLNELATQVAELTVQVAGLVEAQRTTQARG
ncbi:hypothetical protein GTY81_19810 [Streptomyces sp. SID8366]|uniref:hypothetical protein n=1 Tax=unclassified Streptomyces TaxID=2593676 RepID=UPI000DC53122|nr:MULTISPECIES: hypothetical protein [unclassified Streptomyces]MYU06083.1 hypothetical protein [Streptomyces sp. SID8366]MYU68043.1 hypothetical protein [Streptomyces sp. SID69]RAJ64151.1 hypothetical protein K376_01248 [Streptomyces sp. PsTaAH-130]